MLRTARPPLWRTTVQQTSVQLRPLLHGLPTHKTCVPPHRRHRARRGHNSSGPASIRHHPPPRPPPPAQHPAAARRPQPPRRQPGLDTPGRTSYRHHRGATSGTPRRPSPEPRQKNTGRAAAITDTATVTPSSNPRTPNPPDHIKTTPSTAGDPRPVDILNGGSHHPYGGHPASRTARKRTNQNSATAKEIFLRHAHRGIRRHICATRYGTTRHETPCDRRHTDVLTKMLTKWLAKSPCSRQTRRSPAIWMGGHRQNSLTSSFGRFPVC